MNTLKRIGAAALVAGLMAVANAVPSVADEDDLWPGLRKELYGAKPILEADGAVTLDAPYRADDAAVVPITLRIPASIGARAKSLSLIIEKNPMPLAATFTFGPAAGNGEHVISTRVRIDMYSNVRAVLETDDGALHMDTKFVKAAGGCSAPALKDAAEALAGLGKMKLRTLETNQTPLTQEAQVMIRHPNYSGMQMNQVTGLYIPAKYVESMEVRRGDEIVFTMTGGISLSENPNIRFTYAAAGDNTLSVVAKDTDGKTFTTRQAGSGS
ncbi:MAG: quinoprotein dehydrogenase-associated SoxYZ-like carrier [Hyphomicrobiaceae bacterium]|nr:quinoprotein dehydrogenase-associated SoxYZ-like carrier [Hyphomicrobiaceae bacterium]